MTMTIETANRIWSACYQGTAADTAKGWATYTSTQRRLAIEIRQQEHDRAAGCWGTWDISDRH